MGAMNRSNQSRDEILHLLEVIEELMMDLITDDEALGNKLYEAHEQLYETVDKF